jgi:hypothetical protein
MFWITHDVQYVTYRPHINYGGCRPQFFRFEGLLSPAPEVEAIETVMSPEAADGAIVQEYVQSMQEAISQAAQSHAANDNRLCSMRLIVTRMICHDVDTSESAVRKRSDGFVGELCRGWLTRPLPPASGRRNETVTNLARAIRTDRAFDRLPILADALEEAGCDNDLVLRHCRDCTAHGIRCWVIDWILNPPREPAEADHSL